MKKLYRFSAIALLVLPLVFTSCSDYLDRDDDDNYGSGRFCPLRKSERTGFRRIRGCKESRPSAGVLRALQQQCHYGRM